MPLSALKASIPGAQVPLSALKSRRYYEILLYIILYYFVLRKIKKIFLKLWKAATAYVVASIALIQLASVVLANVSSEEFFGYSSETVMQFIFITVLALFPVVLIASYFVKGTSLVQNIEDSNKRPLTLLTDKN